MIAPIASLSTRRTLLRLGLAASAAVALRGRARAQTASLPAIDALYRLRYDGSQAASIRLRTEAGTGRHRSVMTTEAAGLLSLLVDYEGRSEAEGPVQDGRPRPRSFTSRSVRQGDPRTIDIAFAPDTGDVTALRIVRRGRERDSEVPEAMRQAVMDPLTAIQSARAALLAGDAAALVLPVFDGRRRYDVSVAIGERARLRLDGREVDAREVRLTVAMHAGFNERESAIAAGGGWIRGFVTDDGRALPLAFETQETETSAAFELITDCAETACDPSPGFQLLPDR